MSLDEFSRPKEVKDKDAIFILLVRLFLMKPGDDQTHPNMGIGIIPRYRYCGKEELNNLQQESLNQISTYLPELGGVDLKLEINQDNELLISATINDVLYKLETNSSNNTIISLDSSLS